MPPEHADKVSASNPAVAGQPTKVLVGEGTAMVWVSSSGSGDPRPGGEPDPGLCTVTGQGMPSLADPDSTDTTTSTSCADRA